MYAFQVMPTLRAIAAKHEKVVDAVLECQAQKLIKEANKQINQGEEILRRLEEKKFMLMHQGDNQEPSL